MERYLAQRGLWSDDWKQQLVGEFNKEIDEAVEFAENSPYPEPEECLDHVYDFSIRDRELNRKSWTFRTAVSSPANQR
jgi:TPP-dependent pyruvate/acetoin dehydrogenase alpha subunit